MRLGQKFKPYQGIVLLMVGCLLAAVSSPLVAEEGEWSNAGSQVLTVNSDYYPSTMQRYVAPGSIVRFQVAKISEKDTFTPDDDCEAPRQEEDFFPGAPYIGRIGELRKTGGTLPGTWSSGVFTVEGGTHGFTVPDTAQDGQTFTIEARVRDNRDPGDDRRDAIWWVKDSWSFTVSTDCPESMSVVELIDQSGTAPLPGTTAGTWHAKMKANGNPPPGRNDWNGTTVTEEVGLTQGNENEWIDGIIGVPSISGSTFTFGTWGTNQFRDVHGTSSQQLILADGVNQASYTSSQEYTCDPDQPTYDFTITRTGNRLSAGSPAERIKITVAK